MYILNELKTTVGLSLSYNRRLLAGLLVLLLSACGYPNVANLAVESAWVRAMPPGSMMTAAYFVLQNNSNETVRVIGASSPEFSSVSFHESVIEDGVSRMVEIPVLVLNPGESINLEPGGMHLMLSGSHPAGIPVGCCTLSLEFANHEPLVFQAGLGSPTK